MAVIISKTINGGATWPDMNIDEKLEDLCRTWKVRPETISAMVKAEREKQRLKKKRGLAEELFSIIEKEVRDEPLPEKT